MVPESNIEVKGKLLIAIIGNGIKSNNIIMAADKGSS